jgi:hypothetical protein
MDERLLPATFFFSDHRGGRLHRFMESADINAAFRELFRPLRRGIRRGLRNDGNLYALEMDGCIPGELLGTDWIPPDELGLPETSALADPVLRRTVFNELLRQPRPESLFAWVCERTVSERPPLLHLEIVSSDGCWAADYPIRPGKGWHARELVFAPHRRVDGTALA